MLSGNRILIAGLRHVDSRLVELFPWEGSLIEELLAALEDLFLCFQGLLSLLRVGLGLLDFLGKTRAGGGFVGGLSLLVASFVFLCRGAQVAVLENGQQLALANRAAAPDKKLPHRSADLWHNRRLLLGKKNGLRRDRMLDRSFFDGRNLYGDYWLSVALVGRASRGNQQTRHRSHTGDREPETPPYAVAATAVGEQCGFSERHSARSFQSKSAGSPPRLGSGPGHHRTHCGPGSGYFERRRPPTQWTPLPDSAVW